MYVVFTAITIQKVTVSVMFPTINKLVITIHYFLHKIYYHIKNSYVRIHYGKNKLRTCVKHYIYHVKNVI